MPNPPLPLKTVLVVVLVGGLLVGLVVGVGAWVAAVGSPGCGGGDVVALNRDVGIGRPEVALLRDGRVDSLTDAWVDERLGHPVPATEPSFSPDGRRLVVVRAEHDYESAGPTLAWLWTVGTGSLDPRPLTAGPVFDDEPDWSPDGDDIVFVRRTRGAPGSQPMVVGVPGGEVRPLLDDPRAGGRPGRGSGDTPGTWVEAAMPAWSADGRTVAFVREEHDGGAVAATLMLVGADGSGLRELAAVPGARSLSWAPDGRSLLVSTGQAAGGTVLTVDAADGAVTESAQGATLATWSPDGTTVWYLVGTDTSSGSRHELFRGRIEDGRLRPATGDGVDVGIYHLYPYLGIDVTTCR